MSSGMPKPLEEEERTVREIVRTSHSEKEIRDRLIGAGFDGNAAAVTSQTYGSMFRAMAMVWGTNGAIISA